MNQEIEAKILEVNRKKIEQTLSGLGAKKVFDGNIQTLFFDFQDKAIYKAGNVLRLREEEGSAELTFKKVHVTQTVKIAEEYSVEVSSMETTQKILKNLGLTVSESMQKHRVSYKFEGARFDIDLYMGAYGFIPEFLEIEAKNTAAVHKYAALLGFKPEDCVPWSTNELIRHYASRKEKPKVK
jgi:predicted adenylyl cyclase CyaB